MFQAAYITDLGNNPNNATVLDGAKQNTLDWSPIAPTTLCGGSGDPTVNFAINGQTAYSGFISRGLTNVSIHDVDAKIQAKYLNILVQRTTTWNITECWNRRSVCRWHDNFSINIVKSSARGNSRTRTFLDLPDHHL